MGNEKVTHACALKPFLLNGSRTPLGFALGASIGLVQLVASSNASAQPASTQKPGDTERADALFQQARELAGRGRYDKACPLFEESQRLEPATGTLFNLSDCNERLGRTATAWAGFRDTAAQAAAAGNTARAQDAQRRANLLEPVLCKLRIIVKPEAALPGLVVQRNGIRVESASWGTDTPVDPGRIAVRANAPGRSPWRTDVNVDPPCKAPAVVEVALLEDVAGPANRADTGFEERSRVPIFVLGGLALAGIGGGVGFLVASRSEDANAEELRNGITSRFGEGNDACYPPVDEARRADCDALKGSVDAALMLNGVSIGSFVVGGLAAAAAVGYVLWPSASPRPAAGLEVRLIPIVGGAASGVAAVGVF